MKIEKQITAQLRRGTPSNPTKLDVALDLLADSAQSKAAAGRYGAYVGKSWRTWLVTVLTEHALRESGAATHATRERVRDWQRDSFGQALSSRYLAPYAQSLGYRSAQDLEIPRPISNTCASLFEKYKDALRRTVTQD